MIRDEVVLALDCTQQEIRDSLCHGVSGTAVRWSLGALIDLVAAASVAHGEPTPIAFDLQVVEVPYADATLGCRVRLSPSDGKFNVSYLLANRPGDWLTCLSGRRQVVGPSFVNETCSDGPVDGFVTSREVSFDRVSDSYDAIPNTTQVVKYAETSSDGATAILHLDASTLPDFARFYLHPLTINSALQGGARLLADCSPSGRISPVQHIERVLILRPGMLPERVVLRLETSGAQPRVDAAVLDGQGRVVASLTGLSTGAASRTAPERVPLERLIELGEQAFGIRVSASVNVLEARVNSLDIMRLLAMVYDEFHQEVPILAFLAKPNLASLRDLIVRAHHLPTSSAGACLERIVWREPTLTEQAQPLTSMQRALWIASQQPHAAQAYVEHAAWRLRGALDVGTLKDAWFKLTQRHESCRSLIRERDGQFEQLIISGCEGSWREGQFDSHVDRENLLHRELERPFAPDEPLVRAAILRDRLNDEYVLLLSGHHAMCDGVSLSSRLLPELCELYRAGGLTLAAVPLQPRHLAHFELTADAMADQQAIARLWATELAAASVEAELPTDRARGARFSHRGSCHMFDLPEHAAEAMLTLARLEKVSPAVVALTAFRVLLYRWAGLTDVLIGIPVTQRWSSRFEASVGCFVNLLPIHTQTSGSTRVVELLHVVEQRVATAIARQHVPFQRVAEQLEGGRELLSSLTRIGFSYEEQIPLLELPVDSSPLRAETGHCKLELLLRVEVTKAGMRCQLEYCVDLFDKGTIVDLGRRYQRLCEQLNSVASTTLAQLPWLHDGEARQLIELAQGRVVTGAVHAAQLIAGNARRTPERVAAMDESRALTYRELAQRATSVSNALRGVGVLRGQLVVTYLANNVHWPVAVLGAWKMGACFIPLDPEQPKSLRLLDGIDVRAALCSRAQCNELAALGLAVVVVDELDTIEGDADVVLQDDDLAYGIFTSGSTGVPKLALSHHGGVANTLLAQREVLGIEPATRVLQFSSPSFDAAIFEVLLAFGSSSTLCIAPHAAHYDGKALSDLIRRQRIGVAVLTPSVLATCPIHSLPDLKWLLLAGERCPEGLVDTWARGRQLFNLYGPSETSIWVTTEACSPGGGTPTIGRPVPNARVYVLDRDLNLAPVGHAGEICIAGTPPGPGYWNAVDATAGKFVSDPYDETPGARLYRSGDRGKYLADGRLAFLGREDDQIKLHGRRVELGEIEHALRKLPEVTEAVAVLSTIDHSQHIAAFVCSDKPELLSSVGLRATLREQLPSHLVPSWIEIIGTWPRLPSGKIDRRQLANRPTAEPVFRYTDKLQSNAERDVAEAMAAVLGIEVDRIRRSDDFFGLGGHSLNAIALSQTLAQRTGACIPLAALLVSPQVHELATHIEQAAPTTTISARQTSCLERDLQLAEHIIPAPHQEAGWRTILLTGATGSLGSQLLAAILRRTDATIVCLTRARDDPEAQQRLQSTLRKIAPELEPQLARVRGLAAVMDAPRFGLSATVYRELRDHVDAIVHVAAAVNFILPYDALRSLNVESTRALIELACTGPTKEFHYVSSLSALFPRQDQVSQPLREEAGPDPALLTMGYGQSKAVSERLLSIASTRGLPVRIYRPSRIWPTTPALDARASDLLTLFLRGCVQLGQFPESAAEDNLLPVEVVADLVLRLAKSPPSSSLFFHLANPRNTPLRMFAGALRALGHRLEIVDETAWTARLDRCDLAPLQELFRTTSLLNLRVPPIQFEHTQQSVGAISCPLVDVAWLTKQLSSWSLTQGKTPYSDS